MGLRFEFENIELLLIAPSNGGGCGFEFSV